MKITEKIRQGCVKFSILVQKTATNATLSEYGEPEFFNKKNGATIKTFVGYCVADKENVHYQFEPITFEPGFVNGAKYKVSISQSVAEVSEFRKFFKRGL